MTVGVDAALRIPHQGPRDPFDDQGRPEGGVPGSRLDRARGDLCRRAVGCARQNRGAFGKPAGCGPLPMDLTDRRSRRDDAGQFLAGNSQVAVDERRPAALEDIVARLERVARITYSMVAGQPADDEVGRMDKPSGAGENLRPLPRQPQDLGKRKRGVEGKSQACLQVGTCASDVWDEVAAAGIIVHQYCAEGVPLPVHGQDCARG